MSNVLTRISLAGKTALWVAIGAAWIILGIAVESMTDGFHHVALIVGGVCIGVGGARVHYRRRN